VAVGVAAAATFGEVGDDVIGAVDLASGGAPFGALAVAGCCLVAAAAAASDAGVVVGAAVPDLVAARDDSQESTAPAPRADGETGGTAVDVEPD
jgi:hypothetical protein